jgi:hypothetical protein
MSTNVVGTPRKVTLDGTTFDVFADTNIKEIGSSHKNEAVPTSGRNMRKMVKQAEVRDSITLVANAEERDILRSLAEGLDDFPMSYELANGDIYTAIGFIEFENRETETNKATIQMIPRNSWDQMA